MRCRVQVTFPRQLGALAAVVLYSGAFSSPNASAQITQSVTVGFPGAGDQRVLSSLIIQRGDRSVGYNFADLVTPTLTDINVPATAGASRSVLLHPEPLPTDRVRVLNDALVNSGLYDIGAGAGSFEAGSEFVELTFAQPIVNDQGPDLLIGSLAFDFINGFRTEPPDYFVSFDAAAGQVVSGQEPAHRIFPVPDVPIFAIEGGVTEPAQLDDPLTPSGLFGDPNGVVTPVIQALDLSDFGFAPGASFTTLRLQDSSLDFARFAPTLVVGLPAIPEPSTLSLLMLLICAGARRNLQH